MERKMGRHYLRPPLCNVVLHNSHKSMGWPIDYIRHAALTTHKQSVISFFSSDHLVLGCLRHSTHLHSSCIMSVRLCVMYILDESMFLPIRMKHINLTSLPIIFITVNAQARVILDFVNTQFQSQCHPTLEAIKSVQITQSIFSGQ